uniref:Uncharacterized protein n=1 Tax=Glossina palpalis gambiensis TaxID=67801 RepID=A0A1B0B0V7_9MUSC
MVGIGEPSALQLSVAGSCLGTVVSMGCSTIRGGCEPQQQTYNSSIIFEDLFPGLSSSNNRYYHQL